MTLTLCASAVVIVLGATPAAAADGCIAIRSGTNDFDQVRETTPDIPGLPGDGGAYCYPASWTSWMAYMNQNGYPEAMGVSNSIVDWSGQDTYDWVTARMALMGQYCNTSATGGTVGPLGVIDYLESVGLGDQFYLTVIEVNWGDPGEIVTPFLNTSDIHGNMVNGGLLTVTLGWSQFIDGVNVGVGSHVVGVAAIIGSGCADARLLLRDPGGGMPGTTQSPFTFTESTLSNVFGDFQRGSHPQRFKMLPQFDAYGDRQAFLVEIRTLYPVYACALPAVQTKIVMHRPIQFLEIEFPSVEEFDLPLGRLARAVEVHPSGQGMVVLGEQGGSGRLMWFGYRDETFQTVDITPDPGPLAVNRFGEVYVVDGLVLRRISLGLEEGIIHPMFLGAAALELPVVALAVSDENDLVYCLSNTGIGDFYVYERDTSFHHFWSMPPEVELVGAPILVPAAAGRELWLAGMGAPYIYRFHVEPGTGAPELAETIMLPGVETLTSLRVSDTGRVLVVSGGEAMEFTYVAGVGWIPTDETGFAGLAGLHAIDLARTRTNERRYANPEDNPDWPEIRPEVALVPCPADLNWDGIVGFDDLLIVLANWGPCDLLCSGDANEDHEIGFEDVIAVLSMWGPCP